MERGLLAETTLEVRHPSEILQYLGFDANMISMR
jgi:hypothetical protein